MRHQDLQLNHRLESYVYANTAALTGASGFVPGDVGRIAFQQDTGQYWRLITTAPGWQIISPSVAPPSYAGLQTGQLNPTGTSVALPGVMMGMGGSTTITPTATGKLLITFSGSMNQATAGKGTNAQMRYGTVPTAPSNGAAPVGTSLGAIAAGTSSAASEVLPFSLTVRAALSVGTAYWFDLQVWVGPAAGLGNLLYVTASIVELP